MKRVSNNIICVFLAMTLLFLACSFVAVSAENDALTQLWKRKWDYEHNEGADQVGYPYCYKVFNYFPYVLLYLDEPEKYGVSLVETDEAPWVAIDTWRTLKVSFPAYIAFEQQYEFNEMDGGYEVPHLAWLVREMNVSKEDLIAANERMKSAPDSCRPLFWMLTDQEYAQLSVAVEETVLDEYVIDALYVEDFDESCSLLNSREGFRANGEWLWPFEESWLVNDLEGKAIDKDAFLRYLNAAELHVSQMGDSKAEKLQALYVFAETLPTQPETGDPTVAYALIFTLAALPLAGFGVYEWKRRRRAI